MLLKIVFVICRGRGTNDRLDSFVFQSHFWTEFGQPNITEKFMNKDVFSFCTPYVFWLMYTDKKVNKEKIEDFKVVLSVFLWP